MVQIRLLSILLYSGESLKSVGSHAALEPLGASLLTLSFPTACALAGNQRSKPGSTEGGRPPAPVPPEAKVPVGTIPLDEEADDELIAAAKAQLQRLKAEHDASAPSPFDDSKLPGLEGSAKWKATVSSEQRILHQLEMAENRTYNIENAQAASRKLMAVPPYTECRDKSFGCSRWSELGFCKNPLYLRYMHYNCEKTCRTCACQITSPPPVGNTPPPPTCEGSKPGEGCCVTSDECVKK